MAYLLCFLFLTMTVCREKFRKKYVLAKVVQSLGFTSVFCICAYQCKAIVEFVVMLPAFLFCFAGDVLMGLYNVSRKKVYFIGGVFTFLGGHVCFIRWFCKIQALQWIDFIFPLVMVGACFGLIYICRLHTGRLKPFILGYSFFVSMLFEKSVHIFIENKDLCSIITVVAAMMFFVSDISILFLYFFKHKGKKVQLFNLITYYFGMFLFAIVPFVLYN